ncbi:MAG: FAD-dependent oxidoreductase [Proteobacteria bacterium]|nr:FAD-dependent oxidoreductase [Pseudomonadota bacterium]
MRIAIIGSGISGLVAARVLSREHRVTVFEAADYIGGHTNTVAVDLGDGPRQVDTGFIVFNRRTYPRFSRLLDLLGVPSQPSSMTFSVRCDRSGLEWSGRSLRTVFAQRRNLVRPGFLRMLVDIARFNHQAPALLRTPGRELTVREYLRFAGFSRGFAEHYLIPLGASIWSCPPHRFYSFPMRFVVRFLANHGMLSVFGQLRWRVVRGGSARYVEPLVRPFRRAIRLNTPVAAVRRFADHAAVVTGDGRVEEFDHVVLACHSDQALRLLEDASQLEREVLGGFPYQPNDVVLHTDESILPTRRATWSSWNYLIPSGERRLVTLTYNMNILQGLRAPRVACVTVNEESRIEPAAIVRRIRYHHPVYTVEASRYQAMHGALINRNRTSYCGAYWGYGFHEDGVKSALAVGEVFGLGLAP